MRYLKLARYASYECVTCGMVNICRERACKRLVQILKNRPFSQNRHSSSQHNRMFRADKQKGARPTVRNKRSENFECLELTLQ